MKLNRYLKDSWSKTTIASKVLLSMILVVLATVFIAGVTSHSLIAVVDRVDKADDTNRIIKYVLDARTAEKNYFISGDRDQVQIVNNLVDQITKQAAETRKQFETVDNIEQMDQVLQSAEQYKQLFRRYVTIDTEADMHQAEMERAAREAEIVVENLRNQQKRQVRELISSGGGGGECWKNSEKLMRLTGSLNSCCKSAVMRRILPSVPIPLTLKVWFLA